MSYLSESELRLLRFKHLGSNVRISRLASLDKPELMSFDDNCRVDDFCSLSGNIEIGRFVHIAVHSSITASREKVIFGDFSGLAFGCHVFSSSDDYSGESLTNPNISSEFKNIFHGAVILGKHVIVGAGTIIFPGVEIGEGSAIGAMSVVSKNLEPWGIYIGSPARKVKDRSRKLLALEMKFLEKIREQYG